MADPGPQPHPRPRWPRRLALALLALALAALWYWRTTSDLPRPMRRPVPPPAANAEELHARYDALWALGKHLEIADLCQATLAAHPEMWQAHRDRAVAFANLADYDCALADLDQGLVLEPGQIHMLALHGYLLEKKGEKQRGQEEMLRAKALCDQDLQAHPDSAKSWEQRGYVFLRLRRYPEAIRDLDKALALDPRDVHTYFQRATVYWEQRDFPRALQDYDRALSLAPNCVPLLLDRAETCYDAGQPALALREVNAALALNPDCVPCLVERGRLHRDKEDYDLAQQDLTRALAFDPFNGPALKESARAYYDAGDYRQSARRATRFLQHDGEDAYAYLLRGDCWEALHLFGDARQDWQAALRLDPRGELGSDARERLAQVDEEEKAYWDWFAHQNPPPHYPPGTYYP